MILKIKRLNITYRKQICNNFVRVLPFLEVVLMIFFFFSILESSKEILKYLIKHSCIFHVSLDCFSFFLTSHNVKLVTKSCNVSFYFVSSQTFLITWDEKSWSNSLCLPKNRHLMHSSTTSSSWVALTSKNHTRTFLVESIKSKNQYNLEINMIYETHF